MPDFRLNLDRSGAIRKCYSEWGAFSSAERGSAPLGWSFWGVGCGSGTGRHKATNDPRCGASLRAQAGGLLRARPATMRGSAGRPVAPWGCASAGGAEGCLETRACRQQRAGHARSGTRRVGRRRGDEGAKRLTGQDARQRAGNAESEGRALPGGCRKVFGWVGGWLVGDSRSGWSSGVGILRGVGWGRRRLRWGVGILDHDEAFAVVS
jgi:hypothetical protein